MSGNNYLVFDFGASNGRAAVFGYDGRKFEMEVTHRFDNRPVFAAGTMYWDILSLYEELKAGIQKSASRYNNIKSMGLDAWGADFGFLDKNGKLVSNPVHYRDQQRNQDSSKLLKLIDAFHLFELAGSEVSPIFDLFQLFSFSLNQSPEIECGRVYLTIPDIFNYFLTGKTCNEWTRITTTIMYNQVEKKWENKILEAVGLPADRFAPIIKPGQKIGKISGSVSSLLGIKPIEVVAPVTHDTPSAVAGIPVDSNQEWAFLSLGTWAILGKETSQPIISREVFESGYSNEGGAEDSNLFIKNITGLWIIQQCREKWNQDAGQKIAWDSIMEMAQQSEAFTGFIDVENPAFDQITSDMPQVVRDHCQGCQPESIGQVARLFYEGLVLKFKYEVSALEKLGGKKLQLLHLIGGGTKDRLLCQWTADATGIPVIAGPTETTSVGNFLMQLKAAGEISSLKQGREISRNSSQIVNYYPQDTDIWDQAYQKYLHIFG